MDMKHNLLLFAATILLIIPVSFAAEVSVFSMPDNSYNALSQFISNTEHTLHIAAYTITSDDIAALFSNIMQSGVYVKILIDKSPVGGMSLQQEQILCLLQSKGADTMLYDTPLRYQHAKYIVRDSKDVLVSTDNFGYNSFPPFLIVGSEYNRGWGVIVYNELAQEFLNIYKQDLASSISFSCSANISTTPTTTTTIWKSLEKQQAQVETIFAPHNAKQKIIDIINQTKEILYIEQLYIYKNWSTGLNPFLEVSIEKARQGVDVRILLDGRYFNTEKNGETIQYLEALNISNIQAIVHTKKPLHVKGIISDNTAIISSINWNENSATNNREAGIIVSGSAADFYKILFLNDWNEASKISFLSGNVTDISDYSREIIFISIGLVVVIVFLLKNNAFH